MQALVALGSVPAKTGLSPKLLELVNLRASQINGCSVCVDGHPRIARKLGETDERLFAVAAWREAPYFSPTSERAALALTEAVTRISDRADPVPDDIWDEATRHYRRQEPRGPRHRHRQYQCLEPAERRHPPDRRRMEAVN